MSTAAPPPIDALLVLSTVPDAATADRIAEALVAGELAACVNQVPGLRSTYRWKGELCRDAEILLIIKTTRARFDALKVRILELHPHELPEVVAVEVNAGHPPYLDWIRNQCSPRV